MLKQLLTPDQVAAILHLSRRKVLELPVPKVRVGDGRGKILYSESDILEYVKNKTEYPAAKGNNHAGRVQKKQKAVGLQILPSREHLQKLRISYQGGGDTGRGRTAH
jgi:hypothetical protein